MTFHQPNKATLEVQWWGQCGQIVWFSQDFQSSPTNCSLVDTPAPEMQTRVTLTFLWMEKQLLWILYRLSWFSWIGFSANTEFSDLYDFYALKDCIIVNSIAIKFCLNQRFIVHSTWNLWNCVMFGVWISFSRPPRSLEITAMEKWSQPIHLSHSFFSCLCVYSTSP